MIFVQPLGLFGLCNIGGRGFGQHGQNQLQIAHIVPKIFFFQSLELLILPGTHAGPRTGDLVCENSVFFALLHTALFPLVRQLVADADSQQPLMYPFLRIALLEIGFQCPVNGLLRIDGFFNPLSAHHGQPRLERFGFLGRDGLDDTQKLLGVGNIGFISFAIFGRLHFQLLTICQQLICAFSFQAFFQLCPIVAGTSERFLIRQNADHIHNGEIPFLPLCVPHHADFLILKKLNRIFLKLLHVVTSVPFLYHLYLFCLRFT